MMLDDTIRLMDHLGIAKARLLVASIEKCLISYLALKVADSIKYVKPRTVRHTMKFLKGNPACNNTSPIWLFF